MVYASFFCLSLQYQFRPWQQRLPGQSVVYTAILKYAQQTDEVFFFLPSDLLSEVRVNSFEKAWHQKITTTSSVSSFLLIGREDSSNSVFFSLSNSSFFALGDTASNLGSAVDELMRHQPTLKTDATTAIIKVGSDKADHGHERAVKGGFKKKRPAGGHLDSWARPKRGLCLPYFLHVLGLVLCPPPPKSHLSIAFFYRILTSCQDLASICKSILLFLIFVS